MKNRIAPAFLLMAFFDVLVGGCLAAHLQEIGWHQTINDLYQTCYAVIVVLFGVVNLGSLQARVSYLLLFLCYVEDTLFYLWLRVLNLCSYSFDFDGLLPDRISGWFGFVTALSGHRISVPISLVLVLNLVGITMVLMLRHEVRD